MLSTTSIEARKARRFSTDDLPAGDRVPMFREVFGRQLARCDFEPLDEQFQAEVTLFPIAGLGLAEVHHSLLRVHRSRALLDDGDDSLVLQITEGGGILEQAGNEVVVDPGDAVFTRNEEVYRFTGTSASRCSVLFLSRSRMRQLVADVDGFALRRVAHAQGALSLLKRYLTIFEDFGGMTPELEPLAVGHVYDLAAVAMGPTRDALESAQNNGVRAARLKAIKDDVNAGLAADLSSEAMARRHAITPRYLQMLFEDEGTTFSKYVLEQRLRRAHAVLCHPAVATRSIASIAFDIGFNDLSYFNRTFRRQFGATPTDVRAAALQVG